MRALQSNYEECRFWPKWYYHLTFDSLEKGQIFNDDGEYANGMNGVAIGQYIYDLAVVALKKMFKVSSVRELGVDDRCRLAMVLKNKYKVNVKRIARKLQIDVAVLKKLFE